MVCFILFLNFGEYRLYHWFHGDYSQREPLIWSVDMLATVTSELILSRPVFSVREVSFFRLQLLCYLNAIPVWWKEAVYKIWNINTPLTLCEHFIIKFQVNILQAEVMTVSGLYGRNKREGLWKCLVAMKQVILFFSLCPWQVFFCFQWISLVG